MQTIAIRHPASLAQHQIWVGPGVMIVFLLRKQLRVGTTRLRLLYAQNVIAPETFPVS